MNTLGEPEKEENVFTGEKCQCGKQATHKIIEETFNEPRHGYSQYVCTDHFERVMMPYKFKVEERVEEKGESQKSLWAEVISEARFYDGTPHELSSMTKYMMNKFTIQRKKL